MNLMRSTDTCVWRRSFLVSVVIDGALGSHERPTDQTPKSLRRIQYAIGSPTNHDRGNNSLLWNRQTECVFTAMITGEIVSKPNYSDRAPAGAVMTIIVTRSRQIGSYQMWASGTHWRQLNNTLLIHTVSMIIVSRTRYRDLCRLTTSLCVHFKGYFFNIDIMLLNEGMIFILHANNEKHFFFIFKMQIS